MDTDGFDEIALASEIDERVRALPDTKTATVRAVRRFLTDFDDVLAARIKREVNNKLATGLKNP